MKKFGKQLALRNKLAENFDVSKMKNSKGTLKGVLIIIVSEDGKSYNANYQFDDENFKIKFLPFPMSVS